MYHSDKKAESTTIMHSRKINRRNFLKLAGATAITTTLLGTGGLVYSYGIEPTWLDINLVPLRIRGLAPEFQGFRLAQISDLHLGSWMTPQQLDEIIDAVNAAQPDAVAITGDLTTDRARPHVDTLVNAFRRIDAPAYAVSGNHDYWNGYHFFYEIIEDSGITLLSNQVHTLYRENAMLHLCGVEDIWMRQQRLDRVLEALPDSGAAILLAHEPDFADVSAASGRFALQISGHSHGGQIYLPGFGAPVLPRLGKKYPRGWYNIGNMVQYTNRGVGMMKPAVRFNCRPEITVFTLLSSEMTSI